MFWVQYASYGQSLKMQQHMETQRRKKIKAIRHIEYLCYRNCYRQTNSTELLGRQFRKQVLDNTKVQREAFCEGFQRETSNHQGEVLETTTEIRKSKIGNGGNTEEKQ